MLSDSKSLTNNFSSPVNPIIKSIPFFFEYVNISFSYSKRLNSHIIFFLL